MTAPTRLVSLEDVKLHLNKTDYIDDVELQGFIDAATPLIENMSGATINRTVVETHSGGTSTIILNSMPIVSVDSIVETYGQTNYTLTQVQLGTAQSGFSYTFDALTGRITRRAFNSVAIFPNGEGNVLITYTTGRTSVPGNIRLATLMLVQHLWTTSQMNRNGNRPSLGGDDTFMPGAAYAVPTRVKELLQVSPRVPGVA